MKRTQKKPRIIKSYDDLTHTVSNLQSHNLSIHCSMDMASMVYKELTKHYKCIANVPLLEMHVIKLY